MNRMNTTTIRMTLFKNASSDWVAGQIRQGLRWHRISGWTVTIQEVPSGSGGKAHAVEIEIPTSKVGFVAALLPMWAEWGR